MRRLITAALGFLLLIFAAAAIGNNNIANSTVNEEIINTSISGANVAQICNLDANLIGNDIIGGGAFINETWFIPRYYMQSVSMTVDGSNLTGAGDGKTNAIQVADLKLNSTGNANIDFQGIFMGQIMNDLTIGNISQMTVEETNDMGNDNSVSQESPYGVEGFFAYFNSLTNSDLKQISVCYISVNGNSNQAGQDFYYWDFNNDLTNSKIYDQAVLNANVIGNENGLRSHYLALGQGVSMYSVNNDLTNSWNNKQSCLDMQTTGNGNSAVQSAESTIESNLLTTSISFQNIDEDVKVLGNSINFYHEARQDAILNLMTNSDLMQASYLDAYVDGNSNLLASTSYQVIDINDLTNSKFYQQVAANSSTLGNNNLANERFGGTGSYEITQAASYNYLTNSWTNQLACVDMQITGNSNIVYQVPATNFEFNLLTTSTSLQSIDEDAKLLGNGNYILQYPFNSPLYFKLSPESMGNSLTDSNLKQTSVLDAYIDGNNNGAVQSNFQIAADNNLTGSKLCEQVAIKASVLGNGNNFDSSPYIDNPLVFEPSQFQSQFTSQITDDNNLTDSWASQQISMDEQISGNNNNASQNLFREEFQDNTLTISIELQNIDADIRELGNSNAIGQNVDIVSDDNNAVGGSVVQKIEIETSS